MKYDTVIVGGGLAALVCGIRLQKSGNRCLMVSAGQNALHFSSGSFGLLSAMPDSSPVNVPAEAFGNLPEQHPYSKIGPEKVKEYVASVPEFFQDCGVSLKGSEDGSNIWRLAPLGSLKPAWLAHEETAVFPSQDVRIDDNVLIVNFAGYLDFNVQFLALGFEKRGASCRIETVKHPEIEKIRVNPSEMRSLNIARVMDREENWKSFVRQVRELMSGEGIVVLPQVFGLENPSVIKWIKEMIPAEVIFAGCMPPSVPGLRTQKLLKKAFESAGGTSLPGDEAMNPEFEGDKVVCIHTSNLGKLKIEADNFVLASGSFFGRGLEAFSDKVVEPVFGLDVDYPEDRNKWYSPEFGDTQGYLGIGVITDSDLRACKNGETIANLYAIGSELGGCNPLSEGSGAGIAIISAMSAADHILEETSVSHAG